ncbi:hypothetical protein [Planctomicrobium sp. SH664]|uniref:hypothetical protein n=1 Tax=Planctomicrobium sp. SH664 TaxID=3448125 RepID=UPI003F5BFA7B
MWHRSLIREEQMFPGPLHGEGGEAVESARWREALKHPEMTGLSLFAPETYTASYAYPLVVYLHDNDRSERDLWNWFPRISEQNFLGLGVRASLPGTLGMPGRYRWMSHRPDASVAVLRDGLAAVQADWNVHSERITLLGEGQGALIALQQFLLQQSGLDDSLPMLGSIICGSLPKTWPNLLPPIPAFATGRLLLLEPPTEADEFAVIDALEEAGLEISIAADRELSRPALINHWLMAGIATAVF